MRKIALIFLLIILSLSQKIGAQNPSDTTVYLLTCGPGNATYSIYGHSALRIVIQSANSDLVYNWGVFDFDTKNFAWKFAKGRLDYMLGVYPYDRFLEEYFIEKRWVQSQKVNLSSQDLSLLTAMIQENLKPENKKYRYDFFYDDCSTRIRDLLEKAIGDRLIFPPDEVKNRMPTFRDKIGEYQMGYPWLDFGIDLLIGVRGDRKASFRDRMFLPIDLQRGLGELLVAGGGKMVPLLSNPDTILESDLPPLRLNTINSPLVVFSLLLIIIIIASSAIRDKRFNTILDIILYSLFSVLALLMIFFNLFTDHQQLRWNLNIIWLSPFIIICLWNLVAQKPQKLWFRIVFYLEVMFLVSAFILPQAINNSFVPLIILIMLRSSMRSDFPWNPLSLPHLT